MRPLLRATTKTPTSESETFPLSPRERAGVRVPRAKKSPRRCQTPTIKLPLPPGEGPPCKKSPRRCQTPTIKLPLPRERAGVRVPRAKKSPRRCQTPTIKLPLPPGEGRGEGPPHDHESNESCGHRIRPGPLARDQRTWSIPTVRLWSRDAAARRATRRLPLGEPPLVITTHAITSFRSSHPELARDQPRASSGSSPSCHVRTTRKPAVCLTKSRPT